MIDIPSVAPSVSDFGNRGEGCGVGFIKIKLETEDGAREGWIWFEQRPPPRVAFSQPRGAPFNTGTDAAGSLSGPARAVSAAVSGGGGRLLLAPRHWVNTTGSCQRRSGTPLKSVCARAAARRRAHPCTVIRLEANSTSV